MNITAAAIKQLREKTGAGLMEVKRALEQSKGDAEEAIKYLRASGQKFAAKMSARTTKEGKIGYYVHSDGKTAGLVAVACETDFVALTEDFSQLVHDLAMHVTAFNPRYLDSTQIPPDVIKNERNIFRAQIAKEGKPKQLHDKIIEGKLKSYYKENCFVNQPFVKDDTKSIEDLLKEYIAKLGENIRIVSFARLSLGA